MVQNQERAGLLVHLHELPSLIAEVEDDDVAASRSWRVGVVLNRLKLGLRIDVAAIDPRGTEAVVTASVEQDQRFH